MGERENFVLLSLHRLSALSPGWLVDGGTINAAHTTRHHGNALALSEDLQRPSGGTVTMGVWSLPFQRLPTPQVTETAPTHPPGAMLLGWVFPRPAPLQVANAHASGQHG